MILLGLLPVLCFGIVLLALRSRLRAGGTERRPPIREDLLRATIAVGVALVIGTEVLSWWRLLTFGGVLAFWLAMTALAVATLPRPLGRLRGALEPPSRRGWESLGYLERGLLVTVLLFALVILVIAFLAPPQSSDALGYHMARVIHWQQNGSLAAYPTHDERQVFSPPFAEIVRLHLHLLTGSDRFGGLLQGVALMVAALGVSLIAADLGGTPRAQAFALVAAVTIPEGILQGSGSKNEWLVALWLVGLVHFLAPTRDDSRGGANLLLVAAACGLALLTKLTAWFFVLPLLAVFLVGQLRRGWRASAKATLLLLVVAGGLLAPYAARNMIVYGHPLGDTALGRIYSARPVTVGTIFSGVVRNAALHIGTPSPYLNRVGTDAITRALGLFGLDAGDPKTTWPPGRFEVRFAATREGKAGNPGLLVLSAAAAAVLLASRRLRANRRLMLYLACLAAGYVAFCAQVKWQPQNGRILLPMFVLAAPAVATVLASMEGRRARTVVTAAFIALPLLALPALLAADSRAVLRHESSLARSRTDLLFARCEHLRAPYQKAARTIRHRGWRNVGLDFGGVMGHCEYALWYLLEGAGPPVRFEHVNMAGPSAALAAVPPWDTFNPDGIVLLATPARLRLPSTTEYRGARYALARPLGAVGLYAPEREQTREERLDWAFREGLDGIRRHQAGGGFWETLHTPRPAFADARGEVNVFLPAIMVDVLEPVAAETNLTDVVNRARAYLARQIEETGLARYYGRPDEPSGRRPRCVIVPDSDSTALTWRLALDGDAVRRRSALGVLEHYRTEEGLYRTWLAEPGALRCVHQGRDPNPPDVGIQMHLYQLFAQLEPAAARSLCAALGRALPDERIWVYYTDAPLVPFLREVDLARAGCPLRVPEKRVRKAGTDQEPVMGLGRLLRDLQLRVEPAPSLEQALEVLDHAAAGGMANAMRTPPLLYHNDLSAPTPRFYWSRDFGDALWVRAYIETARRWPGSVQVPAHPLPRP